MKGGALAVLLVDDDEAFATMLARLLGSRGIQVTSTQSALGASNLVRRLQPDVVLLDVDLPALTGDALVSLVRKSAPATTRIVLFSSHDEARLRGLAKTTGADGWISKSADIDQLAPYLTRMAKLGGHVA